MDQSDVQKLRPLGSLERVSTTRSRYGVYYNVGVTAVYESSSKDNPPNLKWALFRALAVLIEKHPNLSAVPIDKGQDTQAYFVRPRWIDLEKCVTFINGKITSGESYRDEELDSLIEEQHRCPFDSDSKPLSPFWRLTIVVDPRYPLKFIGCFIFHHTIIDGSAGLLFHELLARELSNAKITPSSSPPTNMVPTPQTELLPNIELIRHKPTPLISQQEEVDIGEIDNVWTGDLIRLPQTIRFESLHVPSEPSGRFFAACKANQTTVTGALHALIASVLFDILPSTFTRIYCGAAVGCKRFYVPPLEETSIGNWTGGFDIVFKRTSGFSWSEARRCRQAYADHLAEQGRGLRNGIQDGIENIDEHYRHMIGQKRYHGFEISSLGVLRNLSVDGSKLTWTFGRVLFSQCASATAGIKVSVSTGADARLNVGFSYSDGIFDEVIKNRFVEKVYEKIVAVAMEHRT